VDRRRTSRYDRFAFNRERAKVAETSIQPLVAATLDTTMKVRGRDGGKTIGTLHAFMVHKRSGRAMYAVLSLGGFLGVGKKNFTTRPIWSSPLLASNRVIVAGQTGELVALNARTGEVEKTVDLGSPTLLGPIAANGTIYVVTDEAQLIALR